MLKSGCGSKEDSNDTKYAFILPSAHLNDISKEIAESISESDVIVTDDQLNLAQCLTKLFEICKAADIDNQIEIKDLAFVVVEKAEFDNMWQYLHRPVLKIGKEGGEESEVPLEDDKMLV